jgi:DNA-binding HxlR family transcriptional regulator
MKKNKSERYSIILSELDLIILKIVKNKSKEFSILELTKKVEVMPISLRKRLRKLESLGFINKVKVPKKNKYIISITENGEQVLKLFNKVFKK